MGLVGISWDEIAIGSTQYGSLRALDLPAAMGLRVVHQVPNSTVFPVKEMGHRPGALSGTLLLTATSVGGFVADVRTGTSERKISFMLGAIEYYIYSYAGDINRIKCLNPGRNVTRQYDVSFSFPMSRSIIYKGADDSTLWGG